jgi:hypothetical protein
MGSRPRNDDPLAIEAERVVGERLAAGQATIAQ